MRVGDRNSDQEHESRGLEMPLEMRCPLSRVSVASAGPVVSAQAF